MELREELETTLGELYSIEQEFGGGGMSRVFLAEETSLGRRVVVKVLPPELTGGVNVDRFGARSCSPRSCSIRTSCRCCPPGRSAGVPYYTMPFVEGESLRAHLREHGRLPIAEAVGLLARRGEGAGVRARARRVHRDIKPDNMLVCGGARGGHRLRDRQGGLRREGPAAAARDGRRSRRSACPSARRRTWRPSRPRPIPTSIIAPTSTRSASWRTRCSPGDRRSATARRASCSRRISPSRRSRSSRGGRIRPARSRRW